MSSASISPTTMVSSKIQRRRSTNKDCNYTNLRKPSSAAHPSPHDVSITTVVCIIFIFSFLTSSPLVTALPSSSSSSPISEQQQPATTTTHQAPFAVPSPPPSTNALKSTKGSLSQEGVEKTENSSNLAESSRIRGPLGDTMYWWFPTQYSLSNARFDGSVTLYDKHFLLVGGCVDSNCVTESSYMDLINPLPPGNVTDLGVLPINLYVNITKLSIRKAAAEAAAHTPVVTLGEGTRRGLTFLEEIDNDEEMLHYFKKGAEGRVTSTNTQLHTLLRRPDEPHVSADPKSMSPQPLRKRTTTTSQNQQKLNSDQYRQDLIREAQIAADIVERQLLVSGQYSAQIVSNFNTTDEGTTFGNTIWTVGPCSAFYPGNVPPDINITTTPPTSTPFAAGGGGGEGATSTTTTFPPFNPSASSSSGGGGAGSLTPQEIDRAFLIAKHRGLWALNADLQSVNHSTSISNQFALRANASCVSYLNRIFIVGGANIDNRPGYRCRRGSLSLSDRIKKFGPDYATKNSASQQQPLHPKNPDNKHFIDSYEYNEDGVIEKDGGLSNMEAGSCPSVAGSSSSSGDEYIPVLFDTIDAFDVRTQEYQPDLISFKTPRMNSGVNVDNALLYIAGGQMVVSTTAGESPSLSSSPYQNNGNASNTTYSVVACPDVEGLLFSLLFLLNESAPFTYVPLPSNPILEIINGFHLGGGLSENQLQLLSSETASRSPELVRLRGLYSGFTSTDLSVWAISKIFSYTGEIIMTTGMSAIAFLPCYPINYTLTPGLFPTGFHDVSSSSPSPSADGLRASDTNINSDDGIEDEQDVDDEMIAQRAEELDALMTEFSYLLHPNTGSASTQKKKRSSSSLLSSSLLSSSSAQDPPPSDVGTSSCINASGFPTTWGFTYTNSDVLRSSILEIPMTVFAGRIFLTFIALGGENAAANNEGAAAAVLPAIRQRSMIPEGSLQVIASKKTSSPFLNSKPESDDIRNSRNKLAKMGSSSEMRRNNQKNLGSSSNYQFGVDYPTATINQLSTSISSISPVDILPYYLVGHNTSIVFFEWNQPAMIRFSPNSACYTNAGGVLDVYLPGSTGRSAVEFTPVFESGAVYLCMSLGQTNISYFSIPLNEKKDSEEERNRHHRSTSSSSGNSSSVVNFPSSHPQTSEAGGVDGDLEVKVILFGCLNPLQPFQFLLTPPPVPSTTPQPTQAPGNNNNNNPTTFSTWIGNSTHAIAFSLIVVTMVAVAGMLVFLLIRARRKAQKKKRRNGKRDEYGRPINDSDDDSVGGGANGLFSVNATDISGRFALDNDDAVVRNTTLDSRYRIKKRIGQGSFSSVYLVKRKSDSCEFAMKYLICGNDRDRLEAIKECETINSIQGHPNIIALYDMFMNYEFNPIPATPAQSVLSDPGTTGNGGGGLGAPMSINNNNNTNQQHQQVGHHQVGTPQFIRNNIAQTKLLEAAGGGGGGYGATTTNHGGVSPPLYAAPAATPPPLPPLPPNNGSHLSPTKPKANVHTRYLCLVMEYHKSGDLCHYLLKNSATNRELFRQAFREFQQQQQIANGGAHHQAGVPFESGSSSYYSNNSTAAMPSQTSGYYQNGGGGVDSGAVTSGDLQGSFGAYTPPTTSPNLMMSSSPNNNPSPNNARAPRYQPLGESALLSVTMQLCSALHHLHSCRPAPIVHRDLKPENVLIRGALPNRHDTYIPVLITDFGLAFLQEENRRSGRGGGTRPYISPESWKGQTTIASDMWSLGCVLYALATERLTADTVRVMFEDVKRAKFQDEIMYDLVEDHGYSLEFAHLVVSLLDADPKKRPTAGSLLKRFVEVDPAQSQKLSSGRSGATPYGSLHSDGQEDNGRTTTPSPSLPNKNSKNDMDGGNSTSSGGNSDHRLSRENSGFSASHDEDSNRSFSASESSSCYNHPDPQRRKFVVLLPPAPSSQSSFAGAQGQPSSFSAAAPGTTRSSGASGRRSPANVTRTRSSGGSSSTHTAAATRRKGSRQGSGVSRRKKESGGLHPENGAAPPTPPRRDDY